MPKGKKESKIREIAEFIRQSGFLFELEVADFLEKNGYAVEPSQEFFDADDEKKREIDLIARKTINNITVCLIIECKQNIGDDWIFVLTQKNPSRYFSEFKHSPEIPSEILRVNPAYDNLHIYNFKFPLAQNYLVHRREKGNRVRVDPVQIREGVSKIPKALVWIARNESTARTIYLPVILFSGSIFEARYKERLLIKEKMLIQYQTSLESPPYYDKPNLTLMAPNVTPTPITDPDMRKAKASAKKLHKQYVVDIISRKGLKRYLSLLERELKLLDLSVWPLPPTP